MISLYTGRPGSGKSLNAVRCIRRFLKIYKSDVVANFEVVPDEDWQGNFTYMPNSSVTVGNLVAFARDYWSSRSFKEDGFLVVLDEAQLLFNSRNWQDSNRMEFLELLSQHRKYGMKIIMIAQADIMIDKQFRSLVEVEVNHRKVSSFGLGGLLTRYLTFGEVFYAYEKYYGTNVKIGGEFFRYKKALGQMYNSYTTFEQMREAAKAAPALLNEIKIETFDIEDFYTGKQAIAAFEGVERMKT